MLEQKYHVFVNVLIIFDSAARPYEVVLCQYRCRLSMLSGYDKDRVYA